jgi:hypothetical protein
MNTNNDKKKDQEKKPVVDKEALAIIKAQKDRALKTNQTVIKNEKDNHS